MGLLEGLRDGHSRGRSRLPENMVNLDTTEPGIGVWHFADPVVVAQPRPAPQVGYLVQGADEVCILFPADIQDAVMN